MTASQVGRSVPRAQPPLFIHTGYGPSYAVACADELVTSGKPGVLLATGDPGPYIDQIQSLVILRGDGTAVLQERERHCDGDAPPCPTGDLPWETPTVQQQCNVVAPSAFDGCTTGGAGVFSGSTDADCVWWPWVTLINCSTIDELSCNDTKAILAQ